MKKKPNDHLCNSSKCDFMLSSQHCVIYISHPIYVIYKENLHMWYVYMYLQMLMCMCTYICIYRERENACKAHFMNYVWDKRGKWKRIMEQVKPDYLE